MVTVTKYDSLPADLADKQIDWAADAIKVALVDTATYTFSALHDRFDDITGEISGTGYTAGGQALTGKASSVVSNITHFTADNVVWDPSTITASGAVIYLDTGTPSTSPLIAFVDFEGTVSSTDGAYTIDWDDTGATGTVFTLG